MVENFWCYINGLCIAGRPQRVLKKKYLKCEIDKKLKKYQFQICHFMLRRSATNLNDKFLGRLQLDSLCLCLSLQSLSFHSQSPSHTLSLSLSLSLTHTHTHPYNSYHKYVSPFEITRHLIYGANT